VYFVLSWIWHYIFINPKQLKRKLLFLSHSYNFHWKDAFVLLQFLLFRNALLVISSLSYFYPLDDFHKLEHSSKDFQFFKSKYVSQQWFSTTQIIPHFKEILFCLFLSFYGLLHLRLFSHSHFVFSLFFSVLIIQRVSEISTLILTSDSSRQEQRNFYV
jgi:hypothetical protein